MLTKSSHSTTVHGWIIVGESRLELAQLGPGRCVVRESLDLPPSAAELFVSVDGDIQHRTIYLPNGISKASTTVAILPT
jgi:hypothetical protein